MRVSAARAFASVSLALWLAPGGCGDGDGHDPKIGADAEAADVPDAGLDSGSEPDVVDAETGPDEDTGEAYEDAQTLRPPGSTLGMVCRTDLDCPDDDPCNGKEHCVREEDAGVGYCRAGVACSDNHPCTPTGCECEGEGDNDGDGVPATECGGIDCDDTRADIYPGAPEICDEDDVDEDCNPMTVGFRDDDQDTWVDQRCRNRNPETGEVERGRDCNDGNDQINPDATDVCDGIDNDCDGLYDEDANGVEFASRILCYRDRDRDLYGDASDSVLACFPPQGYVDNHDDPDDSDPDVYPGAPEICDGKDNDGENGTDEDDPHLLRYIEFRDTDVRCVGDEGDEHLAITHCPADTLWCPDRFVCAGGEQWCTAKIERGCDVDATRLSSCRACDTDCRFACGEAGCDELVELALGDVHACARTQEGRAVCWGRGADGRLGNDSMAPSATPDLVVGIGKVGAIASGEAHACAIVGDEAELYCWGKNDLYQLGNPDGGEQSAAPIPVLSPYPNETHLHGVLQVAAGAEHTCAVLESGRVVCFGNADSGRLGDGNSAPGASTAVQVQRYTTIPELGISVPSPVTDAIAVAVGSKHSCLITTKHEVACWGGNTQGQLGREPDANPGAYVESLPGLDEVTALVAGASHTCVLREGEVHCWGSDEHLQLGRESEPGTDNWVPKPVALSGAVERIAAGALFTCAVESSGRAACWGANYQGQLGPNSDAPKSNVPVPLPQADIASVGCGGGFACSIARDRSTRCWGYNFYGQLGLGRTGQPSTEPQLVHALKSEKP